MVYTPFGREERKAVARGPLAIQNRQLYAGQKRGGQRISFGWYRSDQKKKQEKKSSGN